MTTATPLITGTDFITVATTDFDAAAEFYGNVLGLPRRGGGPVAATVQAGELRFVHETRRPSCCSAMNPSIRPPSTSAAAAGAPCGPPALTSAGS